LRKERKLKVVSAVASSKVFAYGRLERGFLGYFWWKKEFHNKREKSVL